MNTTFESVGGLAGALRRAADGHGQHGRLRGEEDPT